MNLYRLLPLGIVAALLTQLPVAPADAATQLGTPDAVMQLIDALGPATQAAEDASWRQQHAAETDTARQLRELIAAGKHQEAFVKADAEGRTPLIKAVLRGYADIVEALLTDEAVRSGINAADKHGLTSWMAAQFQRPLTLASCHPQILEPEMAGQWGPSLQRMGYFSDGQRTAFGRIQALLLANGAQPDLEGGKKQWAQLCPGQSPALASAVAESQDLSSTLMADTLARWQSVNDRLVSRRASDTPAAPVLRTMAKPVEAFASPQAAEQAEHPADQAMICSQKGKPWAPQLEGATPWVGAARFKAVSEVQDGRVVAVVLTQEFARPKLRPQDAVSFRGAIYQALSRYVCPGDHIFVEEFEFRIR